MALRKIIEIEGKSTISTPVGAIENGVQRLSFSAYIKVLGITGDKSELTATVNFKSESCQFNKRYQVPVSIEAGSVNFIAQVYSHLKSLPEFAGAQDC